MSGNIFKTKYFYFHFPNPLLLCWVDSPRISATAQVCRVPFCDPNSPDVARSSSTTPENRRFPMVNPLPQSPESIFFGPFCVNNARFADTHCRLPHVPATVVTTRPQLTYRGPLVMRIVFGGETGNKTMGRSFRIRDGSILSDQDLIAARLLDDHSLRQHLLEIYTKSPCLRRLWVVLPELIRGRRDQVPGICLEFCCGSHIYLGTSATGRAMPTSITLAHLPGMIQDDQWAKMYVSQF